MKNKTYRIYWNGGDTELIKGYDITSAMNNAGIGRGALAVLDCWTEGEEMKYEWNKTAKKWWAKK